jgi:hypothetical protein
VRRWQLLNDIVHSKQTIVFILNCSLYIEHINRKNGVQSLLRTNAALQKTRNASNTFLTLLYMDNKQLEPAPYWRCWHDHRISTRCRHVENNVVACLRWTRQYCNLLRYQWSHHVLKINFTRATTKCVDAKSFTEGLHYAVDVQVKGIKCMITFYHKLVVELISQQWVWQLTKIHLQ